MVVYVGSTDLPRDLAHMHTVWLQGVGKRFSVLLWSDKLDVL